MNLLTRTSLYYLLLTTVLLAFGGVVFFLFLRHDLEEDFTENLFLEKEYIEQFVEDSMRLPHSELKMGITVSFEIAEIEFEAALRDTSLTMPWEEESQPFKQLLFPISLNDALYAATISSPLYESDDLIEKISWSLALIAVLMLALLFVVTNWLSKKMWQPFFKTLAVLKAFDVNERSLPTFEKESISEFNTLNEELQNLTNRVSGDYHNLKEFTENASHEIQTPLAIIRAKLELLIQGNSLSQEQTKLVQASYETTNRLSKLNQSLLLLSKIENRQFHDTTPFDLVEAIEKKLETLAEMLTFKNIVVTKNIQAHPTLFLNPQLADILLSNILSNAIKHNYEHGEIRIEVTTTSVVFSNSGKIFNTDPNKMFERFQKNSTSQEAVGLGLSIVKQICVVSGLSIHYSINDHIHIFIMKY